MPSGHRPAGEPGRQTLLFNRLLEENGYQMGEVTDQPTNTEPGSWRCARF
jgi:hypothetical protein